MHRLKRVIKSMLHWLGYLFLFCVALFLIALFLLTLSPGEKLLKQIAVSQLQKSLDCKVSIQKVETNLLSRVQVWDVEICQDPERKQDSNVTLGYGRINYGLINLLMTRFSFRVIALNELDLTLRRDTQGNIDFPGFRQTTQDPDPKQKDQNNQFQLPFQIDNLSIRDASVSYMDQVRLLKTSLKDLHLDIEKLTVRHYAYQIETGSFYMEHNNKQLKINEIKLNGRVNPWQRKLEQFSMAFPGFQLTGALEMGTEKDHHSIDGKMNLQGKTEILFREAKPWMPQQIYPINGNIDLSVDVDGTIHQPEVGIVFRFPALTVADFSGTNGLIRASWETNLIDLQKATFRFMGGNINSFGTFHLNPLLRHKIYLAAQNIDFAQIWQKIYGESSPIQGIVGGEIRSSGPVQHPEDLTVSANFMLQDLQYHSQAMADIQSTMTFKNNTLIFDLQQSTSHITANVTVKDSMLNGTYSGNIQQLAPITHLFKVEGVNGKLEFSGTVSGEQTSPDILLRFIGQDIDYQNFPVDTVSGKVFYQKNEAAFQNIYIAGKIDSISKTQPPFQIKDIGGSFHYEGIASGTLKNPSVKVTVNMNDMRYQTYRLDEARIAVHLKENLIKISPFYLRERSIMVYALGEYDLHSSKGRLKLNLYNIKSAFNLSKFQIVDDRKNQFTPTNIGQMNQAGNIVAYFELVETMLKSLQVKGDQIGLKNLTELSGDTTLQVGGQLGFDLEYQKADNRPHADLTFHFKDVTYESAALDSITGNVQYAEQKVKLDSLKIYDAQYTSWAVAEIELHQDENGNYSITKQSNIKGEAIGKEIDIQMINSFLHPTFKINGIGSYNLNCRGTIGAPHIQGDLALRNGSIEPDSNVPGVREIQLDASFQDSTLQLKSLNGSYRDIPLNLYGGLTLKKPQNFDINLYLNVNNKPSVMAKGTISTESIAMTTTIQKMDVSLAQPFVSPLKQLSGTLNTNLIISGPLSDPDLKGSLGLRRLSFGYPEFNTQIKTSVIKLGFNKNEINIDSVYVHVNDGVVSLSGDLQHKEKTLQDVNLQAKINNVLINRPKIAKVNFKSGLLNYKKKNDRFLISGDLVLGESRITYNIPAPSIVSMIRSVDQPKKEAPDILQKTELDVRLRESENIWVDNNLARIRVHSEVNAIGSLSDFNLTGRLSIEEGYLLYLDRKFEVTRGFVDFIDPNQINPIIDFEARAEVKSYQNLEGKAYTVFLTLNGPLNDIRIGLTSEPPLDKPNIIALLTFGATRQQLTETKRGEDEVPVSQLLIDRVESLSSRRISGYVSRELGELFGLERVSIRGNLFQFGENWGPQLLASKKISDRIELTYTTTVGHFNEQRVRLEYKLGKFWYIVGQTNQQGQSGIDFKYKLNFK